MRLVQARLGSNAHTWPTILGSQFDILRNAQIKMLKYSGCAGVVSKDLEEAPDYKESVHNELYFVPFTRFLRIEDTIRKNRLIYFPGVNPNSWFKLVANDMLWIHRKHRKFENLPPRSAMRTS